MSVAAKEKGARTRRSPLHGSRWAALEHAVAAVPGDDLVESLQRVAEQLPTALSVETVGIHLRDEDDNEFHLLAVEGVPTRDVRKLAVEPLEIGKLRSILALGPYHSTARDLGLRWLTGEWLLNGSRPIGAIVVGSRTSRRPGQAERRRLQTVAERLAAGLAEADRSRRRLRSLSLRVARTAVLEAPDEREGELAKLRPRERAVLDLYTDGLAADEIAELFVISPHTVRTHIKHAFRRLGVHSREEATDLVHREGLLRLL